MNLRRLFASFLAVGALAVSISTPAVLADEFIEDTEASVNEVGTFVFDLRGGDLAFQPAGVSSLVDQTVPLASTATHRRLFVNDSHAYNPDGYSLSISASNLTIADTSYYIENSNLLIKSKFVGKRYSCLQGGQYAVEVGGNPFQETTINTIAEFTPLSSPIVLVSATAGRGCNEFEVQHDFELHVPAGTFTDGGNAIYDGTVTITNTLAPSSST